MTLTKGMRRCTALLLSFALVSACARNRYPQTPTTPFDDPSFSAPEPIILAGMESDPPEALQLFPGDVVQLTTVSAKTETYEGLIVDAMGQLHVPLAGDIQVGGLTLGQAEQAVEKGLRRYDRFVRANLIITTLDGHTAVVIGAVTTPGRVKSNPRHQAGRPARASRRRFDWPGRTSYRSGWAIWTSRASYGTVRRCR